MLNKNSRRFLVSLVLVSVALLVFNLGIAFANEDVHDYIKVLQPGEYYTNTDEMIEVLGQPDNIKTTEETDSYILKRYYYDEMIIIDTVNDMPYTMEIWNDTEIEGFSKNVGTFYDIMNQKGMPNNSNNDGEMSNIIYDSENYNYLRYKLISTGVSLNSEVSIFTIEVSPLFNLVEELKQEKIKERELNTSDETTTDTANNTSNTNDITTNDIETMSGDVYTLDNSTSMYREYEMIFPNTTGSLYEDEPIYLNKIIMTNYGDRQNDTLTINNRSDTVTYNNFTMTYLFYDTYGYPLDYVSYNIGELKPNSSVDIMFELYGNISRGELYEYDYDSKE